jgi:hypothetical protein
MSSLKIRLRGEDASVSSQPPLEHFELTKSITIFPQTRADAPETELVVKETDFLEIVLDDNTVWFGNQEILDTLFPNNGLKTRGENEVWTLPSELESEATDRNLAKKVGLKLLNLFVKKGVGLAIEKAATAFEKKSLDPKGEGLYTVSPDFTLEKYQVGDKNENGEYLLFIHGTASSSTGSFDKLKGSKLWTIMQGRYGKGRILALEHRTLTQSPLQNLKMLVESLPDSGTLDLISHSRGGLVADLLCRFATDTRGFDSDERRCLEKEGRANLLPLIDEIEKLVAAKKIKIRRQVRVACPARGTTLASNRLNNLFNIIFNVSGIALGQSANPAYVAFKELIMAAIDSKDDPDILPGIEAMNPASPFIKALNFPGSTIELENPLMVIAGNSKVSLSLRGLGIILSKIFYLEGNDLIVNTGSMYLGAKRLNGRGFYYLEQTSQTNHFNYFANESSRLAIESALTYSSDSKPPLFELIGRQMRSEQDRNALLALQFGKTFTDTVSGQKPIVVLLPGIMGSNLQVKDDILWINYVAFLKGHLTKLAYSDSNNQHINAHSLIKTSYKKLVDYLSLNYDVVTFPFDWRKPLTDCTKDFDAKIKDLMRFKQPIKIIGHSMGGVLVRDFIINHPATWTDLNKMAGFRLVFLGSPLGGSFRIPYVLFGYDDIISKLATIDIRNSKKELLKVFSNLPGILSLLPLEENNAGTDFASQAVWDTMRKAFGDNDWPIPDEKVLKAFGEYRKNVNEKAADIDFSKAVYIAGACRPKKTTPSGYNIEKGKLHFEFTTEGDESVTWASGIPETLKEKGKVYFSNITHGELANDNRLFPAITDVLEKGETAKLPAKQPISRGVKPVTEANLEEDFDVSEEGLERTLLGLSGSHDYSPMEVPVNVSITNGDLVFSKYPVLVGHFAKDGIVSAEKVIDYKLDGELSKRLRLGLHPQQTGENEVILTDKESTEFQGAIIVGLGYAGELTGYTLMETVEKGVAKYLTIVNVKSANQSYLEKNPIVGISILIIGGSYGGLSIEGSLRSVLTGVQNANRDVKSTYGDHVRGVEHVEIIELYNHRALSAVHAVKQFLKDENRSLNIVMTDKISSNKLGRQFRIATENREDWWTRITVRQQDEGSESNEGKRKGLVMTISTNGAREEKEELRTAGDTLMKLISDMSSKNQWSPCLAKTMFELLIPNKFKEQLRRQSNLHWIVDKYSAAFPWELMQDNSGSELPLVVHAGMVRQLATRDSRVKITPSTEKNALVIADPDLEKYYAQLPGALEEGARVKELLDANDYKTTPLFSSSSSDILKTLMCSSYRIIHLAGHGVYKPNDPDASGMVIGKNAFLTVAEFAQMSATPELVFVNCCYLGETDPTAEERRQNRYRLAANIGTQLIENGVKAVVVAGWAIDDATALLFAKQFYQHMLSGNTFGESVKKARKKIYEDYGTQSNTWGAYQCYGDPFYKLESGNIGLRDETIDYVIEEEAEYDLINLQSRLDAGNISKDAALKKLSAILEAIKRGGMENAYSRECVAKIYVSLGKREDAIREFELLTTMESAGFSIQSMEQFCNIRVKHVAEKLDEKGQDWAMKMLNEVITDLQALIRFGETGERLNLLGSALKRQILLFDKKEKASLLNTLKTAAEVYWKAYLKTSISYPLTNWLQLGAVCALIDEKDYGTKAHSDFIKEAHKLVSKGLTAFEEAKAGYTDFWDRAIGPNLYLSGLLTNMKTAPVKKVQQQYEELWKWAGNSNNRNSEIEHLRLIEYALTFSGSEAGKAKLAEITTLREELEKKLG